MPKDCSCSYILSSLLPLQHTGYLGNGGWGARSGTEDDMDELHGIIFEELIKTDNAGLLVISSCRNNISSKGWTRSLLMLLAMVSMRATRGGNKIIPGRPPSKR